MVTPASSDLPECARLQGTFIQLTNSEAAWSTADWQILFDEFRTIGIRNLFVQWTILHETAFFPTRQFKSARQRTLRTIFDFAGRSGVRVWVGLHQDARYWDEINRPPERVKSY